MGRPTPIRAPALVALVILVGLAGAATCWRSCTAVKRSAVGMDGWDMHDLAGYLERQGLRLHLSPTFARGDARATAFLCTTAKPIAELDGLVKDTKAMRPWAGVVYCERVPYPDDRKELVDYREEVVDSWGDCGLRAGPFVFFGDPALLARIRTALGAESSSSRAPATRVLAVWTEQGRHGGTHSLLIPPGRRAGRGTPFSAAG